MTKQLPLPYLTKPRLNYKLIAYATGIVILFPIIISTILIGDKVQTGKIPAYNITTPASIVQPYKDLMFPAIVATPAAIPTPVTVIKTVKQIVKYSKVYSQYTPWKCANGKCSRHVRVYGRI